jgi:hypothetical protein
MRLRLLRHGRHSLWCWMVLAQAALVYGEALPLPDRARAIHPSTLPTTTSAVESQRRSTVPAPKLTADAEFGEQIPIVRKAEWEPWSFSADAEYYYTDNVALASSGALEDFYLRTGVTTRYTNRLSGNWFLNTALSGHTILYDTFDVLDFLLVKGEAGLVYQAPWLSNTFLSAGYTGYWITQNDLQTEAFRNHAATLGLQKIWKISRGMQIISGLSSEYSLSAEPVVPQRNEYAGYLGYQLKLTDKLALTASYRAAWLQYPNVERQDWNHVAALSATYSIKDWARVSLTASQAWNQSSVDFFSYENQVAGLGLALTLNF